MGVKYLSFTFLACMFLRYAASQPGTGSSNAALTHCGNADHIFHGNKCFSIETMDPAAVFSAYDSPDCDGGRQARIYDNGLKQMLGNKADGLFGSSPGDWDCWIGLELLSTGPGSYAWTWWDGTNVNNGPRSWDTNPPPENPATACASMFRSNGNGQNRFKWYVKDCSSTLRCAFCEYDRITTGVSGDPHFLVTVPGMHEPVCFDYSGKDQDVVQLVYSKENDLVINGEIFSAARATKTWFKALSLMVPGCEIIATPKGINVNGKDIAWTEVDRQVCGTASVTYTIKNHFERNSTHLTVQVRDGGEYILSRDAKKYSFGLVQYMDLDLTKHSLLNEKTDGLLGHLLQTPVEIYPNSISSDGKSCDLYFPKEPSRSTVEARYVGRKNPLVNKQVHCWHVDGEGAGLVRGSQEDYLVPHLLTKQLAQTLEAKPEMADAVL